MTSQTRARQRATEIEAADPETAAILRELATVADLMGEDRDVETLTLLIPPGVKEEDYMAISDEVGAIIFRLADGRPNSPQLRAEIIKAARPVLDRWVGEDGA